MSSLNIQYILHRRDLDWTIKGDEPENIITILKQKKSISLVNTFGKLDIYKIDMKYFAPIIYGTSKVVIIEGNLGQLLDIYRQQHLYPEAALFLTDHLTTQQRLFIINNSSSSINSERPEITYKKISEWEYTVHVNAKDPFYLILSEPYNPAWKLYIDRNEVNDHFIVNGYANGWFLTKTGSYDITIEFWYQRLLYLGVAISISTLSICVAYFAKDYLITSLKTMLMIRRKVPRGSSIC
jgi:hypothetical protein